MLRANLRGRNHRCAGSIASWYETLILFWSIGFGLSLPVLVIGLVPRRMHYCPNLVPG